MLNFKKLMGCMISNIGVGDHRFREMYTLHWGNKSASTLTAFLKKTKFCYGYFSYNLYISPVHMISYDHSEGWHCVYMSSF